MFSKQVGTNSSSGSSQGVEARKAGAFKKCDLMGEERLPYEGSCLRNIGTHTKHTRGPATFAPSRLL